MHISWIMCILCTPQPIYRSTSRSTYRPTLNRRIGQHSGRHIGRVSVDMSTEMCRWTYRPMYQPRYRSSDGRHINGLSADISVDIVAYTWPIRWPLIVGRVSVDCRWYISQNLSLLVYKLYTFHPFLVNLKHFWRLHVRPSCAANSVVIKQDTQVKYRQIHNI